MTSSIQAARFRPSRMRAAIVAAFTAALPAVTLAQAQVQAQVPAQSQSQARPFDVPAGELRAALDIYAQQAGVQLVYRVDDLQGLSAGPLKGTATPDDALNTLLSGSGLRLRREGANEVVIFRTAQAQAGVGGSADPVTTTTASAGSASLESVTVTAQRRTEAAQTVPISLTTLTARQLDVYQVQTLKDVSRLSPNLLVSRFSQSSPTIAIRGINNTFSRIGVNKPVAVVLDDVFIPRNSAADFELFDLDSVAVLRGPQGTLFGRNVTGGAIVLNTRKPEFDAPEYRAQATVGNLQERQVKALANLPLNETSAFSLSGSVRSRDGYGRDRLTGAELDDVDGRAVRGQFRIQPVPELDVLLRADYAEDENGGRTLSSNALGDDGNRRTAELGVPQGFEREVWGGSAHVTWRLPAGELTSITAYRRSTTDESYSGVGANFSFLTTGSQALTRDADKVGTFSQELRYASPKWSAGNFITGLYYLREDGSRRLVLRNLAARTGAQVAFTQGDEQVDTTSYALFADGTVHLGPTLDLSAGARYTRDEKTASLRRTNFLSAANSFNAEDLTTRWSEWTPRVALTWRPASNAMAYASVTRGFTSGGYNTEATTLRAFTEPFAPETVTNYETGVKTQWLDNRLRFNLSVFRMKYKDKQELLLNSNTGILTITNASSATVPGAELELAWRPAQWVTLSLNYAQLRGRYDRFELGNINYTGNPLASSPKRSWSLSADWRYPLGESGFLLGSVNHARVSTYNTGAANDPNLQIPGYGLTSASLGYEPASRRWRVLGWVRNAADTEYILTRSTQVVRAEYLGEPRTYGVTFTAEF